MDIQRARPTSASTPGPTADRARPPQPAGQQPSTRQPVSGPPLIGLLIIGLLNAFGPPSIAAADLADLPSPTHTIATDSIASDSQAPADANRPSPTARQPDLDALLAEIDALRRRHDIAATAVVLVDNERTLAVRTFGVRNRTERTPADPETRFKIGSISKAITGLALLRAEDLGLLGLDRPLTERLPDLDIPLFDNPWQAETPLTLAMLMEHTAGWHDMSRDEFDHPAKQPIPLTEALAVRPASRRSHWRPGVFSEYSNSGPGLAGFLLERAAGESFETFVERELFAPLGMTGSSFLPDPTTLENLAQGYDRDARSPIPYWHILYRPSGGLNVRPADMAPLLRLLLRRGELDGRRLFAPERIDRLETPSTTAAASAGTRIGYALGIQASQHRGHTLHSHGGDGDGYLARIAYSRTAGRGYFVVITAFDHRPLNAMRQRLSDWLIADLPPPPAPPEARLQPESLTRWTGTYQLASTRFPQPGWQDRRLTVSLRNGRLHTQPDGQTARPLIAIDPRRFRRPHETEASTTFSLLPDGSIALQGPLGNWLKPAPP
ncbi:MAG TPA: hypothetical protein DDZ76_12220 [Xanthomonadales bacterium]|nr:hypothetical protein [Xanthomonadales bacterium]